MRALALRSEVSCLCGQIVRRSGRNAPAETAHPLCYCITRSEADVRPPVTSRYTWRSLRINGGTGQKGSTSVRSCCPFSPSDNWSHPYLTIRITRRAALASKILRTASAFDASARGHTPFQWKCDEPAALKWRWRVDTADDWFT